jgi:phosphate transport system substrate-binding protein
MAFKLHCIVAVSSVWLLANAAHCHAQAVRLGGTGAALATMQALAESYAQKTPTFKLEIVPNLGTSGGLKAINAGAIDIAAVTRAPTPEEATKGLVAMEYGRTPLLVASSHPTPGPLDTKRIVDLLTGSMVQWPDGTPVRVVLRPLADSDTTELKKWGNDVANALTKAHARPGMLIAASDREAANFLEKLPGSLGTTTLALVRSEQRKLHAMVLNGVEPTVENLREGRYPLGKSLFLVTRSNADAATLGFAEFVRSTAGRQMLTKLGHWVSGDSPR